MQIRISHQVLEEEPAICCLGDEVLSAWVVLLPPLVVLPDHYPLLPTAEN